MTATVQEKVDIAAENWDCIIAPTSAFVVVTTVDKHGRVNAASYGSCARVAHDPVYLSFVCTQGTDTHANILETGEFVVNLVPFDPVMLEKALQIGLPWKPEINELERVGLTEMPSHTVRAPRIGECYAHFELKVAWSHEFLNRRMFCGAVTAVSANADCVDENQMIVWDRAKPAHYCGGRYMDQFVPAYEATRIDWDWRALEARGTTDADFRTADDGVEEKALTPTANWRDMLRSQPRSRLT